jgi:hypothetical protein
VVGPDGLSLFDELRRRNSARSAILYAFDLIEHNGEDLRGRPFLERKEALARLLAGSKAGILYNDHLAAEGATVFAHACKLGAEGKPTACGTEQTGTGHGRMPRRRRWPLEYASSCRLRYLRSATSPSRSPRERLCVLHRHPHERH